MFLNQFSRLVEIGQQSDLYVFKSSRSRASLHVLLGSLAGCAAGAVMVAWTHPAFLLLLAPLPVGSLLLSLFLVWSQCTLEVHPNSRHLRLRSRGMFGEKIKEWKFEEIEGLIVFGDDPDVGVLQLKFPYGNRVSLGRGKRSELCSLATRLSGLTGLQVF